MPFALRKIPKTDLYRVYNKKTKRVYSRGTTIDRARRQLKFLRAITYNKNFKPQKRCPSRGRGRCARGTRCNRRTRRCAAAAAAPRRS